MSASATRTAPPWCGARSPLDPRARETASRKTDSRPAPNAPAAIDRSVILLTNLVGGAVSSLVKSGSEPNLPPRVPGEVSPPVTHLDAWLGRAGIDWHALAEGIAIDPGVTARTP